MGGPPHRLSRRRCSTRIEVDNDPERAEDQAYADEVHAEVESAIQAGMDRLAAERTLPVLG